MEPTREVHAEAPISLHQLPDALKLIKAGKVYSLDSRRWNLMPVPDPHPPFQVLTYRTYRGIQNQGDQTWLGNNTVNMAFNSDLVMGTVHSGTHLDALSHVTCGEDNHWHGGRSADRYLGDFGALDSDGAAIPPIITRGVLIDVAAALELPVLPARYPITVADMENALKRQGTSVGRGDVVLFRTGYMSLWPDRQRLAEHFGSGITIEVARHLSNLDVQVVGADSVGLEVLPSLDPQNPHPVHIELLINRGIYIMEYANLEQLSKDRVYEFFFVCLPLKIHGTTGSMVNPVAIV